jgi:hypothetical protein
MRTLLKVVVPLLIILGCSDGGNGAGKQAQPIDHTYADYARLLNKYVSDGLVDYARMKADRGLIDSLIDDLASADLSGASSDQQLAFYINAYNLITLRSIVDHYPVESIKDIDGVWDDTKWELAGGRLTLNDIEHEILRKEFNEPRIHVAIVCASTSCPPLVSHPYLPDKLNLQLPEAARNFVMSSDYNKLDPDEGSAEISSIFDWFGDDFIDGYYDKNYFPSLSKKENAVLNFLIAQFPEPQREKLLTASYKISYLDYDWSLNDLNSKI